MKKPILLIICMLFASLSFAQIGINNTDPKATLDVTASNVATPANTDGILIPRVAEFPTTNPTAAQDGMMIFITGTGTPSKGFYYWDNTLSVWKSVTGAKKINDLIDGKSDNDGTQNGSSVFLGKNAGANDDSTDNKNVGVGYLSLNFNTGGSSNTAVGYKTLHSNTTGSFNTAVGKASLKSNTTGSYNTALGNNTLNSNTSGDQNIAIGNESLKSNTTGSNNVAFGNNALINNTTGGSNTAIGYSSLFSNTTGNNNVALGAESLRSCTSGYNNTAVGHLSLKSNITGYNNTSIGHFSLKNNTTGDHNTAVGESALAFNTAGGYNTALGESSLGSNTTGSNNTAVGTYSLFSNMSGLFNTGLGGNSLFSNTIGNYNTAVGHGSLYLNTTGNSNTAVGYGSLEKNTTGVSNTGIGYKTLYYNTTGNSNVSVGYLSLNSNTLGSGNIAIGHSSLGSNTTGDYNTSVGISSLDSNTTGNGNSAIGNSALFSNITGKYNVALGGQSLRSSTTGDNNTALGYSAGMNNSGNANIYIGYRAGYNAAGDNKLYIENTNADANGALIYGEFGTDNTTSGNILRTNSEFQIGNPITTGYAFPTTDGTTNQVMATDGAGQVSFVDTSSVFTDTNTQNTLDQAYDEGGAGAGRTITADNGAVAIAGVDGFQVTGTQGSGAAISLSGAGTRMFFNPKKAAFRVGGVDGTQWDDFFVGRYSFASGFNTMAVGHHSTAMGSNAIANGNYSIAMGSNTLAVGESSTAMGSNTSAVGNYSTAMGSYTLAAGESSTAMGVATRANGNTSTAMGGSTTAYGDYSLTAGYNSRAYDFASVAMGNSTIASGETSVALGRDTQATGNKSVALGERSIASGPLSFASGLLTTASGSVSVAIGNNTTASGDYSTAMGSSSTASGKFSTAMGLETTAPSYAETTIGSYSKFYTPQSTTTWNNADRLFVVANGVDNSHRSHALTIYKNGLMNINDAYNMPLTDGTANQVMATNGAGQVSFVDTSTVFTDTNTQNTLDQAYDEGGAGAGRIINTTDGAVLLNGADGLKVKGAQAGIEIANTTENESGIHFTDAGNITQYADIKYDNGANNLLNFYVNSPTSLMTLKDNQRVGIGTTAPSEKLSVAGTANLNEGLNGVALRVNYAEAIWYNGSQFSWGYGGTENYFADKVGIGTNSPAYKLDVADVKDTDYITQIYNKSTNYQADGLRIRIKRAIPGSVNHFIGFYDASDNLIGKITGSGTGGIIYNTTSDRRLKTNIVNIDNALEIINKIQPRKYEFKAKLGVEEYGFIAQELQPVYPQAVSGDPNGDVKTDPMMVDYSRLTPILTAGVKELKKEVDTLQTANKQLKKEVKKLRETLTKYQNLEKRLQALENKK